MHEPVNVTPAVGADVLYRLTAQDAERVNSRRADFRAFNRANRDAAPEPGAFPGRSGHVGHSGNQVSEGDVFPAKVVREWGGGCVNLQVHLDGNDALWATSSPEGTDPGQWSWPLSEMAVAVAGTVEHTAPRVGDQVHYVSHGSPVRRDGTQAYESMCRAAIVTEAPEGVDGPQVLGLCVLNPTGMFFDRSVPRHDGGAVPGDPECLSRANHGNPFRYCACGWTEPHFQGGTWHRGEH